MPVAQATRELGERARAVLRHRTTRSPLPTATADGDLPVTETCPEGKPSSLGCFLFVLQRNWEYTS